MINVGKRDNPKTPPPPPEPDVDEDLITYLEAGPGPRKKCNNCGKCPTCGK